MALQSVSTVQNITFSKMIYISFLRSSAPGTRNQFQWKNVVKTVVPNGEEIDLSNEILATSKLLMEICTNYFSWIIGISE